MPLIQTKILKIDTRIWWAVFFISQCIIGLMMIISFVVPEWNEIKGPYHIKGSLRNVKSFNGLNPDISYDDFYSDYCDTNLIPSDNFCDEINNLWNGGSWFEVFEFLSLVSLFLWFGSFTFWVIRCGCDCHYTRRPHYSSIKAILTMVFHYIAFFSWTNVTDASFGGSCKYDAKTNDTPSTCTKDGPNIALFLVIFIPIVVFAYIIVSHVAHQWIIINYAGQNYFGMQYVRNQGVVYQQNQGYPQQGYGMGQPGVQYAPPQYQGQYPGQPGGYGYEQRLNAQPGQAQNPQFAGPGVNLPR